MDQIESARDSGEVVIRQHTWRLMQSVSQPSAAVFDSWNGVWEGALSVHNRHLTLEARQRLDQGDPCFEWRVRARRRGSRHPEA